MANRKEKSNQQKKEKQRVSLPRQARGVGVVRIVGGQFKRTPLNVDPREGLRPTSERVRETVFDWLTHLLGFDWENTRVCDMFSGSGAMGLEAASRGAQSVLCIEKDRKSAARIAAMVEKLHCGDRVQVKAQDAFEVIAKVQEPFRVIFIDPPFASQWQEKAVKAALKALSISGFLYVESDRMYEDEALKQWGVEAVRRGKAGAVHYAILTRYEEAA